MVFDSTKGKRITLWIIVGAVVVSFIGLDILYALWP